MVLAVDLVDTLNRNTGAVQAIATLILAGLTFWYVIETRRIADAARLSQRPYVHLDVSGRGGPMLEIGVGNFGERAANNVQFNVQQDVLDGSGTGLSAAGPFDRGIPYLPPGRMYRWSFISPQDYFADVANSTFRATITYEYGGTAYEEDVVVDFASFEGVLYSSLSAPGADAAAHLKSIARSLDELQRIGRDRSGSVLERIFPRPPCPRCREPVNSGATKCPHCLEEISLPEAAQGDQPNS
ncbi:MAG: hypothetical protein WD184_07305 [Acidimicrobiia bacterium]